MNIQLVQNKLLLQKDLSSEEAEYLLETIFSQDCPPVQIAALLTALTIKGETVKEMISFIRVMRKHMLAIPFIEDALDTCGTGGDGSGTFNISTTVALVVAGAGVIVAKHGNRSASSSCGSADVLEALGVHIMLTPQQAQDVLEKVGCVFLFAPLFHPALKPLGVVRKDLGFRTVFNYLGPFCNPAKVTKQLVGVPNKKIALKLVKVAQTLGYKNMSIVTSSEGLDEISLTGKTHLYEVKGKGMKAKTLSPQQFGFKRATMKELQGATVIQNAEIISDILNGEQGAKRDIVVLNAAYVLVIAGKAKDIPEGMRLAEHSLDSGNTATILELLIKETNNYA